MSGRAGEDEIMKIVIFENVCLVYHIYRVGVSTQEFFLNMY
jgi:hypothetical protein